MSFGYNIDKKKIWFPAGAIVCGRLSACLFSPYLCGFSLGTPVSSHISKDVHVRLIDMSKLSQF